MSDKPFLYSGSVLCSECGVFMPVTREVLNEGIVVHPCNPAVPCSGDGKRFWLTAAGQMEKDDGR